MPGKSEHRNSRTHPGPLFSIIPPIYHIGHDELSIIKPNLTSYCLLDRGLLLSLYEAGESPVSSPLSNPPYVRQHDADGRRITDVGCAADGAQGLDNDRPCLREVDQGCATRGWK